MPYTVGTRVWYRSPEKLGRSIAGKITHFAPDWIQPYRVELTDGTCRWTDASRLEPIEEWILAFSTNH